MSEDTGISVPQLYRYAAGAPIPSDRLAKITALTGESADWILHGTRLHSATLNCQKELHQSVLDTIQYQYRGPAFNPVGLSKALQLFWINQKFMDAQGHNAPLTKEEILWGLHYIAIHAHQGTLDLYLDMAHLYLENPNMKLDEDWAHPFCEAVRTAAIEYYNSQATYSYFARMNGKLDKGNQQYMQYLVDQITPLFAGKKLDFLDIACGCGRHIGFLHRNYEFLNLYGLDPSDHAETLYLENISKGLVPENSFIKGDYTTLKQHERQYDIIYNHCLLHYIPLVENNNVLGVGKFLSTIDKLLKPGGLVYLSSRTKYPNQLLPIYTFDQNAAVENILKSNRINWHKTYEVNHIGNHKTMPGVEIGKRIIELKINCFTKPSQPK